MSVKKVGSMWSYRVDVGRDPHTGKRRQVYKSGFKTKREAELAKSAFVLNVKENGYFESKKIVFGDFLTEWLESIYKNQVQETTYERGVTIINLHLLPAFKHRSIDEITTYDLQCFFNQKHSDGLSPAYLRKIKSFVQMSLEVAFDWELITKNPASKVRLPKLVNEVKETWSADDVSLFLENCEDLKWKVAFRILLETGIRRGEVLALKWSNIDFDNFLLYVKESLARSKNSGLYFKSPKTRSSIRTISISSNLVNLLTELKQEQQLIQNIMGASYGQHNLVISTEDGKPLDPRNLYRKFKDITNAIGLPNIPLHGLRHTNATLLMKNGVHPKVISSRLGHSKISTTMNIYTHVDVTMQQDCVNILDKMIKA